MNLNKNFLRMLVQLAAVVIVGWMPLGIVQAAGVTPSNMPLANIDRALSNVMLDLSVEFPTGDTASFGNAGSAYDSATTYYGYFDPAKCYQYSTADLYFSPVTCGATVFKGNFLNWASMANIDQFRQIMTGGNRIIDTSTLTVLQRAYNDSQSNTSTYFRNKTATTTDAGTAAQNTYRSAQLGDKMLMQPGTSVNTSGLSAAQMATQDCATLKTTYKTANGGTNPAWTCYHVRVKVCDAASGLETNCKDYSASGGSAKPEGLMQQYEQNMRFAAFGYLNDPAKSRQGGVLRARMKSIGPTMADPINISSNNPNLEWSATTGVLVNNPDSADQAATAGATNSGVINYLNNFGYGSGYKGYDPMAELYYESLRYLRKMKPTTASLATYTNAMADNYPVINFDPALAANLARADKGDPVISACQQNFIVAIGDVNNHCDTRVPGGTAVSGNDCGGASPTDDTVNFSTWTNTIKTKEGGSIGATDSPGRYAKWYMGGMAYWGHVNDIRPDRAAQRPAGQIQNVTTFMVDVMEPFNGSLQTGATVTPFFTPAKYGGFDRTFTASPYDDPNTFKSGSTVKSWDKNANGTPDNWYAGNDPVVMKAGLTNVFQQIVVAGSLGDGAAPATSGTSVATANKIFYASYSLVNGGRGNVKGCSFTSTINACDTTPDWDAAAWLDPTGSSAAWLDAAAKAAYAYQTYTTRQIITRSGGAGVAFKYTNLSATDKAKMDINPLTKATDTPILLGTNRVDYIRGDSSKEISKVGGVFRTRAGTQLGDVVGAGPVFVGAPSALYSGSLFPGYSQFLTDNANRKKVLYVGANDGMLHAFDAANGKELLAYVPGYFLKADPATLAAKVSTLTMPTYTHQFYVDATPMVGDVNIAGTWTTLLVGGYGAGGKGFYALDITDPTKLTEANAASLSKWELSDSDDADMGYTYNQPALSPISGQALQFALIPKASGGNQWAVIVGNGFGSAAGKAVLYFLNPQDGTVIAKVEVENATGNNGLATPFPADTDSDGIIDTIWAGDLQGNMWRISWDATAKVWTKKAAFAGSASKPITAAPAAAPHSTVLGAWAVTFGTGKYIERADYNTTTQQSLYGIADTGVVDPASATPITQSDLVQQTITATSSPDAAGDFTRNTSSNAVTFTGVGAKKGWYLDLPTTNGERSTVNPLLPADTGLVLLSSYTPASACLPGTGYVNVLNAATGAAYVDNSSGTPTVIPSWGGVGMGIPYFSTVVSNADTVVVKVGGVRPGVAVDPKSQFDMKLNVVKGVNFSWRQIR